MKTQHLESAGNDSVNSCVESSQLNFSLQLSGSGCPVRSKALAVTAPRSKELNQPHVIAAIHQLLKVAVRQLNHVLRITSLNKANTNYKSD